MGPTFAALALFRRAVPSLLPHMRRTHLRTQALALLDMYDALSSVSDDLAATLAGPRFLPLLSRLAELADAAQDEFEAMFADFEAGLARPETWKAGVTDGSVRGLGAAMRCRRVDAVFEAALCAVMCTACRHAPIFFCGANGTHATQKLAAPLHSPNLTIAAPPRSCAAHHRSTPPLRRRWPTWTPCLRTRLRRSCCWVWRHRRPLHPLRPTRPRQALRRIRPPLRRWWTAR